MCVVYKLCNYSNGDFMKWIIINNLGPIALHIVLDSATKHMRNIVPTVVWSCENAHEANAYGIVYDRFRAFWTPYTKTQDSFRAVVLSEIESLRNDGTLDPMTLLTSDTQVFTQTWNPHDAWTALMTSSVLGVKLTVEREPWMQEVAWKRGRGPVAYGWMWGDVAGELSVPFTLGTVYRTSDIIGPMERSQWDSLSSLQSFIGDDPAIRRTSRLACLTQKVLTELPCIQSDIHKYCQGYIPQFDIRSKTVSWITPQE